MLRAHRFSVAPMMDWTDRHCRAFHRHLTRHALLYTEMVTVGAIIHGPRDRLLSFSKLEHPIALQLGGSNPADLATCARIGEDFGYDEINLNVGCPSDRVQNGTFGACLMLKPDLVAECVAAMKQATHLPVTVKCRLGVDDQDPEQALNELADRLVEAGVDGMIVHARKAWLKGLSPRENREIPPLDYDIVFALKGRLPHLPVCVNGGISSIASALDLLAPRGAVQLDGVMLGRAAYQSPAILAAVDRQIFGEERATADVLEVLDVFRSYVVAQLAIGVPLHAMTRHILGLFHAVPGARQFRRHLSVEGVKRGAGVEVYDAAIMMLSQAQVKDVA